MRLTGRSPPLPTLRLPTLTIVQDDQSESTDVVWRALTNQQRPLWRRLSAQKLAQAEVHSPDGTLYWVRISRNMPAKMRRVNDLGSALDLAIENLRLMGDTGWSVTVLQPSTRSSSRKLFRQKVDAKAIVVDIAFVIVEAIRRGDRLWDDD